LSWFENASHFKNGSLTDGMRARDAYTLAGSANQLREAELREAELE